jgi:hypothetical protein
MGTAQASGPFAAVTVPLWDLGRALREGLAGDAWLRRLVSELLRVHYARAKEAGPAVTEGITEEAAAHAIVRRACVRSAVMGGATGLFATGASVLTAETSGAASLFTLPLTMAAIGVEAVVRLGVHLEMVCSIADLFDIAFDPERPADLWALLSLSFGPELTPSSNAPRAGADIARLAKVQAEDVGKRIGKWILGEGVARNAVPFVNIAASSVTSYAVTKRLGDNARRYARYRRAFDDALDGEPALAAHLDLLIEGVWFLFTADGQLEPEESALLASLVRRCDAETQERIGAELADDIGWMERLPQIPEDLRDPFLRVLEVASAVDKRATLRERRLLEHAARALGRREDFSELERMMRDFRDVGVLSPEA